MAGKWQVHTDEYGNLYFYNTITGESVWELPDEEESEIPENQIDDISDEIIEKPQEYSVYTIAVGVADVMVKLVETIETNTQVVKNAKVKRKFMSFAAEKRFLKNAANDDKKKKHLHDRTVTAYVNMLIPKFESGSSQSKERRGVGSLFTAEESRRWQQQRDQERQVKRRAIRRARQQHQAKVESLQKHQQMLILFRSDLMKYLLGKILCSTELQRQRILLLTSPQMLAEMKERKKEMQMKLEPEIAEKMAAEEKLTLHKYEKNIRKVFAAIDEAGRGKLHLLQILFGVFSKERPQKYAAKVRGLAELLGSTELQRFLIDFVTQTSRKNPAGPRLISPSEFREFITIIEEVIDHYEGVKAAVEDAENDIETTLAAASSGNNVSLVQARMGALSAKKISHELAVLKEHDAQLQAIRHQEKCRGFDADADILVPSKEEWEKNHHHRLIRLNENLPVFCCLCRRRKWELWRREQEEIESEYRSHWPTMHALCVKNEELRFVQERDHQNGIPVQAREPAQIEEEVKPEHDSSVDVRLPNYKFGCKERVHEDFFAVQETLVALVRLVESTVNEELSEQSKPQRRVHKKMARSPRKRAKELTPTDVQERIKVFENEEQERKTMYTEELHMVIMLERNRRIIERPHLRAQDAAHDALVRLLAQCVNPSGFLSRLDFERCLSFVPPQKLVLAVSDMGVKSLKLSNRLVLQTIPCRTESMGDYIFTQATHMQKSLRSPFVAEVISVDKHMFQSFSQLGLLVECWPVVFVVTESFDKGSWLTHYRRTYFNAGNEGVKFSAVEQHIRNVFREVASGLAAMHSLGLLHLNVNLSNIYITNNANAQDDKIHVRVGGLLSWKHDYDVNNLQGSDMHDCFNHFYAPPEIVKEMPITAKVDAWLLGCALCEALFMWQRHQLILSTPNQHLQDATMFIFHTKSVNELLQQLPIATSASMRSIIRMLLQPNPAQRPQMSQVVDLLCSSNHKFH